MGKNGAGKTTLFRCISLGLEGKADYITSLNIRNRAAVNQPVAAGAIFDHIDPPSCKLRCFSSE
ncbi:MAG: hypothetical protein M1593_00575 [Candidatus Thermoplasmatota archaeon]|nr:hypothetical protein [Candidatus Thermoplasmatota archaeon]